MIRKGIALFSVALLSGCGSDITPTYQNEARLSADQKQLIDSAWQTFKAQCPHVS